jgi:acid phosphatase type 7
MNYVSTGYSRRDRRRSVFRAWPFLVLVIATLSSAARASDFDPSALYLGWQRDPTRTMTVHWHHDWREQGYRDPVLEFRPTGHGNWKVAWGNSHPAPFSDKIVNVVEIADLAPDTEYEFRFGKIRSNPMRVEFISDSPQYRFITLPSTLAKPLKFVVGGDIYSTLIGGPDVQAARKRLEIIDKMNRQAAATNPAFVVIGGDIAYDNGRPASAARWDDFLAIWKKGMLTPGGRIIPTVAVIGNHETHADAYTRASWPHAVQTPNRAPFFTPSSPFQDERGTMPWTKAII